MKRSLTQPNSNYGQRDHRQMVCMDLQWDEGEELCISREGNDLVEAPGWCCTEQS